MSVHSQTNQANHRQAIRVTEGSPATDGAGVKLTRFIGSPGLDHIDPFLLLDAFETDNPDDYIAGFPAHPHRGFETITYMLEGRLRHRDNQGHEGLLEPGGIQWMTAGRGVIHSEMPEQENGRMIGFQLWVNLPARLKMIAPNYQEYRTEQLPVEQRQDEVTVKIIAGKTNKGTESPVKASATAVIIYDVDLPLDSIFTESLPAEHHVLLFTIDGEICVHGDTTQADQIVPRRNLAVLSQGKKLKVTGQHSHNRFLLIAGKALEEPIVRGGPFVMNTHSEIQQAFKDFRNRKF